MTAVSLSADALLPQADARPRRAARSVTGWPFQAAPDAIAPDLAADGRGVEAGVPEAGGAQAARQAQEALLMASHVERYQVLLAREMRRRMAWDVVMVVSWGALVPALMWLGAAAGF
ncbi:hypothetical protein BBB39_12770 [Bordetella trematum]|uniref:Uncharacterized protein n=1 Tax=Bordetella trematum TaxID=123899 RepID=A0A157STT0_9BORD|nr:hypothetical protein [Bordetella trematum]AZR94552.1 hypothetical protein BBB39_12770 [Bordetella trematum]NNH19181.1 hypothetical protein [Bordetella trematum]CZZ85252.1 Uncharacterised protein [Bordetella trematum]SAI73745.1 Uncharacterised protein [Bordetella trematum]SUV97213.1 Uncharacterised protein [Bordetella trematum]